MYRAEDHNDIIDIEVINVLESITERRIGDKINKMPELYQKVLYWYYTTGSVEKAADKIELTESCVERILNDAFYIIEGAVDFEICDEDYINACKIPR